MKLHKGSSGSIELWVTLFSFHSRGGWCDGSAGYCKWASTGLRTKAGVSPSGGGREKSLPGWLWLVGHQWDGPGAVELNTDIYSGRRSAEKAWAVSICSLQKNRSTWRSHGWCAVCTSYCQMFIFTTVCTLPPSLSLLEAQANRSLAFTLAKWQPQLTYCCVITVQHLAMPMRLEQKPSCVGGGFPQRPWQTRGWAMDWLQLCGGV